MSKASDPQGTEVSSQMQVHDVEQTARTAAEAGWHESRYNIAARIPGSKTVAIYNTY